MHSDKLDLPFTDIITFAKVPHLPDLDTLDTDVAMVGASYDLGTQVQPGGRYGPCSIRVASTAYRARNISCDSNVYAKYYDAELDDIFLEGVLLNWNSWGARWIRAP